jgi:hypothetical protein
MHDIYPKKHNPYYIVAPRFIRTSAGIRVLYLLCHHLNLLGYQAYIINTQPHIESDEGIHDFIAPMLTDAISHYHHKYGITPIIVYPETICGNPLNAEIIARYVLNYPGLLGGNEIFDDNEMIFTYSEALAKNISPNRKKYLLFIPACNSNIFYPPKNNEKRRGSCFSASKYQNSFNGKLLPLTKHSFEITRDLPDSLTPQEIADLFRKSELFYTYENTSLATEAVMCGCPAIFIPSDYMKEPPLALKETGSNGTSFGISDEDIKKAKDTVHLAFEDYQKTTEIFKQQLENFIKITQMQAKNTKYEQILSINQFTKNILEKNYKFLSIYSILKRIHNYYVQKGLIKTIKKTIGIIEY